MHKDLLELLHSAKGESRHVVVIFLDVRGFSSFAKIAESSDTAEFLKSAYLKILDDYFPGAEFFKPTGDGLLVLYGYDRATLTEMVRKAVDLSIRLVEGFPTISADDPMVNFEVPEQLGIGLARGAATSLTSGQKVLDYSGRPLNLASRLMDLARPAGVVFDQSFGFDLLEPDVQARFRRESVYIKGIAEQEPLHVYCLEGSTEIPAYNKSPLNRFDRHTEETEEMTLKELEERGTFLHELTRKPARTDDIIAHVEHPSVRDNGTRHPTFGSYGEVRARHEFFQNIDHALVDYAPHAQDLKSRGVKSTWPIRVTIEYSVTPDA